MKARCPVAVLFPEHFSQGPPLTILAIRYSARDSKRVIFFHFHPPSYLLTDTLLFFKKSSHLFVLFTFVEELIFT